MIKSVYQDLWIIEKSKIVTYDCWYDYVKPKYRHKMKLYYMDTDSFITQIKLEDIYEDLVGNVK